MTRRRWRWTPIIAGSVVLTGVLTPLVTAGAAAPVTGRDVVLAGLYSERWESGVDLDALAAASGKRVSLQGSFHDIEQSAFNVDWILEQAWGAQATPFANVTIQASAASVASGMHDSTIAAFAARVESWLGRGGGRSLLLAPLQEMNGDWTPYGMDPPAFRAAYRKFVDAFRARGMDETKVRFVFAPNGWSTPPHRIADYYPGDEIVDLIGISTYNFGTSIDRWTSVTETMAGAVEELRALAPAKPYLIAQVGSSTSGGDRDAWLRDMFAFTAADPNVVGFIYFNLNKETDWRVWTGTSLAAGWRDGMQASSTLHGWPLTEWFRPGPIPFSTSASAPRGTFVDDDDSPFEADIEWLVSRGITRGCAPDRFCPRDPVTRAQMASFLARALGLPPAGGDRFSDDDGSPHEPDIERIAEAGITLGCASDRFCPHDPVTRAQMASFLARALGVPPAGGDRFSDDDGSPHEPDIERIAEAGITLGCAPDRFCPHDPVTREQMAAFLRRALDS